MSENDQKPQGNIQATDNSNVIGGDIVISGVIQDSSHIHVGHTIGYSTEQVSALITQISNTFQVKPFDGRCPYKGLDVFEEEDAGLFFGREKLVDDLVSRVKDSRTVFVTGPSGSGKSSLARAGLIHALKQGAIKESHSERWLYATMKPGRDPIGELARVASSLAGSTNAEDEIRAKAMADATIFARWCEITLKEGRDKRVVLFIDQFEEVFTQINKEEERAAFLNLLTHAAAVENGRVIVLFSMRSDFIPNCATYPQMNDLLNKQFIQIGAMQPEELVSAIAQPALRVGLKIDPDLIAQIINDMKGEPGALPLMQFALKDLFEAEQAKGDMIALTLNDYIQRGGIQKSLERHADAAFAKLGSNEQELARSIFGGLIEIGRGTVDTRRTALFNELVPTGGSSEEAKAIVQKLADARLITTDDVTVTISHEKLIDAWPWLKKLVNENRDVIALQNEIAEDAKEWEEHNRDESYLYTGARLVNAREKLETRKLVLSGLAQSFVDAGIEMVESKRRAEEDRRQRELDDARKLTAIERRARLITNGVLAATIVLVGALSYVPSRNEIWRRQAMKSEMKNIPADNYLLGDQRAKEYPDNFLIEQKYPISSFSIDLYPVTNRRYKLCLQAGVCSRPEARQSGYMPRENANKLVVNVTAVNAAEFCNWIGGRLPSEKEWELAARKNVFMPTDPNDLTEEVIEFYEWTTSQYDQDDPEWLDISVDPPEVLIRRGGQFNDEPSNILSIRQNQGSMISENSGGFRCAISQ